MPPTLGVPALRRLLKNDVASVLGRTAKTLGSITPQDEEIRSALQDLLPDENWEVQKAVMEALRGIQEKT